MTHTYNISGMTCTNCVARVRSELLKIGDITAADIQLKTPQATISMQKHIPVSQLQTAVAKAGKFRLEAATDQPNPGKTTHGLLVYKPLLLIFAYIAGIGFLLQTGNAGFNLLVWMQHFMAGFFLVFSFFKILDLQAFANSYSMYDIAAKRWKAWGYIYPFVELGLGIAYLLVPGNIVTNLVTLFIMLVSISGVLQAVLQKRKIQCACLGAIFNLPMSTITIVEDGLMIGMSVVMLLTMI